MAIYVRVSSGSTDGQVQWSGSNVDVPFDGTTAVVLQASDVGPTCDNGAQPLADGSCADGSNPGTGAVSPAWTALAAGNTNWELLDAPEGTAYDRAWFVANNGGLTGKNPLSSTTLGSSFIPDKEGSWFFQVTNTATSESIYFVVCVMNVKTNLRIPAAGETNQADQDLWNRVYATMSNQGWAKDRNEALRILGDMVTAGGTQICYFDDAASIAGAPWGGSLKAGAAVALNAANPTYTLASGETVPRVRLADGNTNYHYVGLVKHGWYRPAQGATTPNVARRWPKVETTTAIPNQTLIVVSRAGFVEAATGINPTTPSPPYTSGQLLYLSATPGILQKGTDRFILGALMTAYVVPACILATPSATNSKFLTVPHEYLGGISAATEDQSFRFVGVGDFRGLRIGSRQAAAVAGENPGVIEMLATNGEGVLITAGTVCCISTTMTGAIARVADSYSGATSAKYDGIIGVAIQDVANTAEGHFAIYGPIAATTYGTAVSTPVYVGSSKNTAGDRSGRVGPLSEVAGNDLDNPYQNKIIPVGMADASGDVWLGIHQSRGFIDTLAGTLPDQVISGVVATDRNTTKSYNKTNLYIKDATTSLSNQDLSVGVKVAGSGSDDSLVELDLFESRISGSQLYDTATGSSQQLMGVDAIYPGATVSGIPLRTLSPLYGTFAIDHRLDWGGQDNAVIDYQGPDTSLFLKIYATVPAQFNASAINIQVAVRLNTVSVASTDATPVALPSSMLDGEYPYWPVFLNLTEANVVEDFSQSVASNFKTVCWELPLVDNKTVSSSRTVNGNVALGSKQGSSGGGNLGLVSPNYSGMPGQPSSKYNTRRTDTVDMLIYRTDFESAAANSIVVTGAVLQSTVRKQLRGRRSRYEASIPGHGLLTDNANMLDILNTQLSGLATFTEGLPVTGNIVGTSCSTAGGATNNAVYGFFAKDSRISVSQYSAWDQSASALTFRVYGKFSCPNVGAAPPLTLQFYVKEITKDTAYNKTITTAPDVNAPYNWTPVPSQFDAGNNSSVSTSYHQVTVPAPTTDNVIGWWFKIQRTGVTDINGQEDFFCITNIQLEAAFDNSRKDRYGVSTDVFPTDKDSETLPIPQAIYEHHVHPSAMTKGTTTVENASLRYTRDTDITGFGPLQTGGIVNCEWTSTLDSRYDDKCGLFVEVYSAVATSGGSVDYDLSVRYSDCYHSIVNSAATTYTLPTVSVSNTAAFAGTHYMYKVHRFSIPPEALWDVSNSSLLGDFYDNPDLTEGRNKGVIKFSLTRTDTNAYNTIILGALVCSNRPNKTKAGLISPLNINEAYAAPPAIGSRTGYPEPVYLPGYTRSDSGRSLELSIQRFTWSFTNNLSGNNLASVAAGASMDLLPSYWSPIGAGDPGNQPSDGVMGQFIPYSFAITDIYGVVMDPDAGGRATWEPVVGATDYDSDRYATGGLDNRKRGQLEFFIMQLPSAYSSFNSGYGPGGSATRQDVIVPVGYYTSGGAYSTYTNSIAFPGVENFPFVVLPDYGGAIRWNASAMNNRVHRGENSEAMPKVVLPADYVDMGPYHPAGHKWQLVCRYKNTGPAAQTPKIGITVEVALLPNLTDKRHSLMGGARSSGRSYFNRQSPSAYPARLPKISDLGIDTTVLKEYTGKPTIDAVTKKLNMYIGPYSPINLGTGTVIPTGFTDGINSYLRNAPSAITIAAAAGEAALTVTIYGENNATGTQAIDTVTVVPAGTVVGGTTFNAVDGIFVSASGPTQAAGLNIRSGATILGNIAQGKTMWGVIDFTANNTHDGIVCEADSGPTVADVWSLEFNTNYPKQVGRRRAVFGKDGGGSFAKSVGYFKKGTNNAVGAPGTESWKTPISYVTDDGVQLRSIAHFSLLDWGIGISNGVGNDTLRTSPFSLGHTGQKSWPYNLKVAFAVMNSDDSAITVTIVGKDAAGGALSDTVAATLWDPSNAVGPTWTYSTNNYVQIDSISLSATPVGEWLVGNFAVPWEIQSNNVSRSTGMFIAYANVIY